MPELPWTQCSVKTDKSGHSGHHKQRRISVCLAARVNLQSLLMKLCLYSIHVTSLLRQIMAACIALRPNLMQEIPSLSPLLFWYILFGPEFGKTRGRFSAGSGMKRQEGLPYFYRRKLLQCQSPALLQVSTYQIRYRRPSANSLLLQQQTGRKAETNIQYHWARFSLCCRGMEQEEIRNHLLLSMQYDMGWSRDPSRTWLI